MTIGTNVMVVRSDIKRLVSDLNSPQSGCAVCPAYEHALCDAVRPRGAASIGITPNLVPQAEISVRARRLIVHEHDFHDSVPIICSGWAATVALLPDGRRQILSFLLPGDIVSAELLFAPQPRRVVEAITDVRYRKYKRAELKNLLSQRPALLDRVLKAWLAEATRANRLIVDLGRRSGEERIAQLILSFVERLTERNLIGTDPIEFEFPLRQHQIADAIGMTQVHVSKVISDLRRAELIEFRGRNLTVLDLAGLRARASMRYGSYEPSLSAAV